MLCFWQRIKFFCDSYCFEQAFFLNHTNCNNLKMIFHYFSPKFGSASANTCSTPRSCQESQEIKTFMVTKHFEWLTKFIIAFWITLGICSNKINRKEVSRVRPEKGSKKAFLFHRNEILSDCEPVTCTLSKWIKRLNFLCINWLAIWHHLYAHFKGGKKNIVNNENCIKKSLQVIFFNMFRKDPDKHLFFW